MDIYITSHNNQREISKVPKMDDYRSRFSIKTTKIIYSLGTQFYLHNYIAGQLCANGLLAVPTHELFRTRIELVRSRSQVE